MICGLQEALRKKIVTLKTFFVHSFKINCSFVDSKKTLNNNKNKTINKTYIKQNNKTQHTRHTQNMFLFLKGFY